MIVEKDNLIQLQIDQLEREMDRLDDRMDRAQERSAYSTYEELKKEQELISLKLNSLRTSQS